jgi:hypothetical protein
MSGNNYNNDNDDNDNNDDSHFYIDLAKLDQNTHVDLAQTADDLVPPSVSSVVDNVIKVDMSEIVSSLDSFSKMVQSRRFSAGEMTGWNAGVCISCPLGIIAMLLILAVLWYLLNLNRNNLSNETICNCNCKCDYLLPSSTSPSSTQFINTNITAIEMIANITTNF